MNFIALKTEDSRKKGKITFFCKVLDVSRQGFYQYLINRNRPWKYQKVAELIQEICHEDLCNDTYGRIRMYQALQLKKVGFYPSSQRKHSISYYEKARIGSSSKA